MSATVRAYLALGANVGDAEAAVRKACKAIDALPDTRVVQRASLYRTAPVGFLAQPDFINTVVGIDTQLDAPALFAAVKEIERALGRKPRPQWHEREIDIDILTFDGRRAAWDDVVIPHPRLHERRFVLVPFAEIAPHARPTSDASTIEELLQQCADTGAVSRVGALNELA